MSRVALSNTLFARTAALLATVACGLLATTPAALAQSTAIVQQLRVAPGGVPFTGQADLRFALFGAQTGGSILTPVVEVTGVPVVNGVCLASIDFGNRDQFTGQPLWMMVRMRPTGSTRAFTLLPRHPLSIAGATHGAAGGELEGTQGPVGEAGPQGLAGPQGAVGAVGAVGPSGPVGPVGPTGATGPQGAVGPQGATGIAGAAGADAPKLNPLRVGANRWYLAYYAEQASGAITTGPGSSAIAFDGQHLWISLGFPSVSLMRVDPATRATTTFSLPLTTAPVRIVPVGSTLWLLSSQGLLPFSTSSNTSGSLIATGAGGTDMLFDGQSLWITGTANNLLFKASPSTGAELAAYALTSPKYLAFDGASLWVSESTASRIAKIDPTTGAVLTRVSMGVPTGVVTFDGTNVWAFGGSSGTCAVIAPSSASIVRTISMSGMAGAAVTDGRAMWVIEPNSSLGSEIFDLTTGVKLGTVRDSGGLSWGAAFDGVNVWVIRLLQDPLIR